MEHKRGPAAYIAGTVGISGALLSLEWIRITPSSPLEYLYIALLGIALVPVSILLVSTAVYLGRGPASFPSSQITDWPSVAVLYVSYNDMLPQAIAETLRNLDYPNAQVWLLSDSTRTELVAGEQALPGSVRIFRRRDRRGGKAGAINDWLRAEGEGFRFVVPMDADAILAKGTLRTLVETAAHPQNRRYAGFQTLMEIHPAVATTPFARILGRGVKWGTRIVPLANQRLFGQGMYWGSNALLRTDVVRSCGGWVEDNICEDFALTARLDAAGHPIALVDLYNYEGFPPDALSLRERTIRWCKANLSVAPSLFRMDTSFAIRLNVVIPILFYAMAPTLLALLLINMVAPPDVPLHRTSTILGAVLLTFVFLHRLVVVPRKRVALKDFAATLVAETLVVLSMALRISWAFVENLFHSPTWTPSRKQARRMTPLSALRASIPEVSFGALLIALIVIYRSPANSTILASVWIASFLSTPVILWWSSRTSHSSYTYSRTRKYNIYSSSTSRKPIHPVR